MSKPIDGSDDENERLAEADAAEGRVVPHIVVREWLKTLGTPEQIALRSAMLCGATSPPAKQAGSEYFAALRRRVRGE